MKRILVPALALLLLSLLFAWGVLFYPMDGRLPSGGSLEAPAAEAAE